MNIEPEDTNFYSSDPVKMEGDQMSDTTKTMQEECYGTCWGAEQRIDELTQHLNEANQHIKRLKQAGDVMYTLLDPPSISMRTTEYDNALQGWDDAKTKY